MAFRISRFTFLLLALVVVAIVLYTSSSHSSLSTFGSSIKSVPESGVMDATSEKDYESHQPARGKPNLAAADDNPELERFPIGSAVIKAVDAAAQTPPTKEQLRSLIEGGPVAAATAVSKKVKGAPKVKGKKPEVVDLETVEEDEYNIPQKGRGGMRPNEARLREGLARAAEKHGKSVTDKKKPAAAPKPKVVGM